MFEPGFAFFLIGLTHQNAVRMDGFGFRARPNLTHAGHGDPAEHNGRTLLRKS